MSSFSYAVTSSFLSTGTNQAPVFQTHSDSGSRGQENTEAFPEVAQLMTSKAGAKVANFRPPKQESSDCRGGEKNQKQKLRYIVAEEGRRVGSAVWGGDRGLAPRTWGALQVRGAIPRSNNRHVGSWEVPGACAETGGRGTAEEQDRAGPGKLQGSALFLSAVTRGSLMPRRGGCGPQLCAGCSRSPRERRPWGVSTLQCFGMREGHSAPRWLCCPQGRDSQPWGSAS